MFHEHRKFINQQTLIVINSHNDYAADIYIFLILFIYMSCIMLLPLEYLIKYLYYIIICQICFLLASLYLTEVFL